MDSDLKSGDVVLVLEGGWGLAPHDRGKYAEVVMPINKCTVKVKPYGADFYHGEQERVVNYESFGSPPIVLLNTKETRSADPLTNRNSAIKSDGGSSSYYDFEIPQHYLDKINETGIIKTEWLIDFMFKNDFDFACAFKALVRARGIVDGAGKEGNTLSYELNKNRYYSDKIEEKHGN